MSEGEDSAEARLRKKTIPLLRSVLVANAKSGVPLHLLCHEYQETCLEPLSFRNMGYGSLEQFLRDIPEVCSVVRSSEGFLVVKGIATKEDAHIYKLVSGQRNPKKKLSSKKPLSLKVTRNASFFKLAPPRSVSSSTEIQSKKTLYNSTFRLSHHLPPAQYNSNRLNFGSYFKQKNEGPQWSLIVREKQYNKNKDVIDLTKDDISKKNKTFTSKQGSWQSSKPVSSFNKSDFSSETNLYCSTSSIKETKDLTMEEISSLEKKIRDLLKLRPNGLWLTRLKPEFKTIYKEDLQCDIKSVIEKHFLHFVDIQSPAPNREILYLKQSTIDSSTDSDKLVISISNSATESNRSVLLRNDTSAILGLNSQNSNKSNDLTFLKQNPGNTQSSLLTSSNFKATWVEVPVKEEYLDVIVNCVVSTKYISVIMLGPEYNEKLEQLENEISELYQNSEPVTSTVCLEVGRFYAAYFDSSWYRVELLTVASNECQVLLVDHGKKETIAAAEIKDLPIKYLALPFQAISCSLYKVPESFDADILQYLSEITDGNALIAHIIERPNKNNKDFVIELYSSSNEAEESINQELISRIETENNLQPQLAEEGYQTQGYITHITPEGELFVQILGPGLERLEILMMDMASHFSQKNSGSEIIAHPEIGEVCCAKYPNDGAWYRAQVTQILTEEHKVEVEFVDYGNQTVLSHLHIRKPTAVSEKVVSLPFQAIKCQVYGLAEKHFDANSIEKMKYFVESYLDVVIIESVKVSKVNLPLVKIFVPDGENDLTSFVDWFLKMLPKEKILEVSITSPQQDDTTHNFIKSANLPVDSSKTKTFLNPKLSQQKRCFNNAVWKIPEIQLEKSIFEGFVQEVVHPHKFLIVPTSLWNDFQTMHMELLSFYKDKKDCEGTHFEVGDLCAVYSKEDELWHRAIIHANIEEKFVVNFPDSSFNIEVVSIENIQVLDSAFTKFPFFAIRCSLDGIEPISGDKKWSNEASSQFADKVYLETFQVEIVKSCLNTKIFHVLLHGASLDDKHFIVNDQLVLSGLARNRFNNVLSQLFCELEEFSQKDESASCKQIKILTGKLLQLLSSSEVNCRELLQKQNNIQVLFQVFKTFCTKDQQITLNILESISKVCTAANRISSLLEVGILSVLFDCLTKMAANVSILQNDILSIDTLTLCHVLIAKVAPKEKKFAIISRLYGALQPTVVILKLYSSDKIVMASIQVLKLNATSSVNCALMIKFGIVTLLQKIITTCGQRKVQILKASLDLLSAVLKLEKGVKKAVNVGMIIQLLNAYKTWHKWDLKNCYVSVRKSILNAIKACVMFSFGSKVFFHNEGFRTIYFLAIEHIDKPEVEALIRASIVILRKCSMQKIPLRTAWCPYSFPLPQGSLFVKQTSSASSTSGQCSPTHSVIEGETQEEKNIQLCDVLMKISQLNINFDKYADFMPELNGNEESELHLKEDSVQDQSDEDSVQDQSDEELMHGKSSHSFRHISSFLINPAPDVLSNLPPFQPELLFEKKSSLLRYKIFEDFQRILFPETVLTRTVFDLDELIYGVQSSHRQIAEIKKVRTASMKTEKLLSPHLKPPLKKYYSVRDLAGPIQKEILKKDPLTFESRFESGNLRKAIQVRSYEYDLILNADINTSSHHQWFYFQVGNMESRVPYRFNIINCEKANSQFNYGMQPLFYSMKESQRGGCQRWIRAGNNICYYKNHFVKDFGSKKHYYTTTFTIEFPHAKDMCYLAYHYPYTYSLLITHLYLTQGSLSPLIFYRKQVLCNTLAGNEVPLITITSKEMSKTEKIYVFLTARVHPGETNSSWMMKGIVDFLTSNNEEACFLRSAIVFKIIPMLNPDGVINGCHRCSLSGQDLNRKWKQPDADLHPTIFHTKSLLKYLVSIGKRPEIFVDFHGHSRKKNIFMYGCREFNAHLSESLTSLQLESNFSNSFDDIELLPKILNRETPYFCMSQCNFSIEKCKESTARVVSYREFGIRKSYTMESTYCGMDQGKLKGCHIGTDGLEDMGRSFCKALLKLPILSGVR